MGNAERDDQRPLRIGAAGLGRAFSLMLPTFRRHPLSRIVAGADPRPEARQLFADDFDARAYATVEDLCADAEVEAVYISTPHHLHAEQARMAASRGKHILVEKPMALSTSECLSMITAARAAGVHLIVGHSHSFDAPIARARALVASGAYGPLRMVSALNFTDFLYRPRRPEELDTLKGGGVIFNQAPHQVDILRLLGGGRLASVRACAGSWDQARPTQGAYSAFFTFENGCCASLTYSGYAHFDSDEFCGSRDELGDAKDPTSYGHARKALAGAAASDEELALKASRNYGGPRYAERLRQASPCHQHFGFVLASCEKADLRPGPTGVTIYGDQSVMFEACPVSDIPRREVIDELHQAVVCGRPPVHDGEWGLATMEACLAILTSSKQGREIQLEHQIGLRDE